MNLQEIAGIITALEEVLGAVTGLVDDKHIKTLHQVKTALELASELAK